MNNMELSSSDARNKMFIIAVHDVEPRFASELSVIADALRPRVGTSMSAAVVPASQQQTPSSGFAGWVRENFDEVTLHGYSHRNSTCWDIIALLTDHANEFSGLSESDARERLHAGQEVMAEVYGGRAKVFVPPAWCRGAVSVQTLAGSGLSSIVTLTQLLTADRNIPLATYSWDCGRIASLGYVGELLGRLLSGIPCITFHPADVQRGFLKRGLKILDRLLETGFEPITFEQCAEFQSTAKRLCAA